MQCGKGDTQQALLDSCLDEGVWPPLLLEGWLSDARPIFAQPPLLPLILS